MKAYVLINVRTGAIPAVIKNLLSVGSVQSAEMTFGEYDIIATIMVDDVNALAKVISKEVQTIPDILQTTTCMAVVLG